MEDNQISLYCVMIFDHYIMLFIRSQVILMIIL
jgi:hypothetical protein